MCSSDLTSSNVKLVGTGILTQPVFQLASRFSDLWNPNSTTAMNAVFDRGQAGGRAGGVELARSFGRAASPYENTTGRMTTSSSNTRTVSESVQYDNTGRPVTGGTRKRVSWRQLR